MTELGQIYKCEICGNIVQVLHTGKGELVCCGEPMIILTEKTEDVGYEKHLPVAEKSDGGVKVKVGATPHPMEIEHHIEWIEVIIDGGTFRKKLNPTGKPEADFCVMGDDFEMREYCNVHGLWSSKP